MEALELSERFGEGDILAMLFNVFELQHIKSLKWMKKVNEEVNDGTAFPNTLKALRSEIMNLFLDYLDEIDELVTVECDESQRKEVHAKLEKLLNRLKEN